jgi:hypothetical protein
VKYIPPKKKYQSGTLFTLFALTITPCYNSKDMPIYKAQNNNEKKELDFELKYQKSLSLTERFRMMAHQSKLILQMLIDNGHRKPTEIIKRA